MQGFDAIKLTHCNPETYNPAGIAANRALFSL